MTDIDNVTLLPQPPLREPTQNSRGNSGFAWSRALTMVGVLTAGLALGAGGFAVAAGGADHLGWKRGAHLALVQAAVSHALDSVGANAAQEAKVHDIIAIKFAEITPDPGDHEALRKQTLELLAAETIDRAAVEKLRSDIVATFDAKSKMVVSGLVDIADQLTPAQRVQLTSYIEEMAQRGPMMGARAGVHAHQMDESPNGGPDSALDKD